MQHPGMRRVAMQTVAGRQTPSGAFPEFHLPAVAKMTAMAGPARGSRGVECGTSSLPASCHAHPFVQVFACEKLFPPSPNRPAGDRVAPREKSFSGAREEPWGAPI